MLNRLLTGILVLVATAVGVIVMDGNATIALIGIPMGLYCIFDKNAFDD